MKAWLSHVCKEGALKGLELPAFLWVRMTVVIVLTTVVMVEMW